MDCGDRKIVEEIHLRKYDDFEQFSFSDCVKKLRGNLDDGISLNNIKNNEIIYAK